MIYRLYTENDFSALFAIEESCFQPPFQFARRYMRRLVNRPDTATWIAEQDGRMAGFAIAEWIRQTEGPVGYIQTLEVAPFERGQGIGGRLIERIEGSARAAGAQAIWLHVDMENVGAIRLYEAHGYLCQGREENYYPLGHVALVYRKQLETGMAS